MKRAYSYEHLVTFDETNLVGNVYFANHLRWQGHCRELFLRERAPAVLEELRDSLVLVTTRCSCDYFAELTAFDRVVVRMTLGAVRQNRVVMHFEYLRDGSELVARGEQEVACMTRTEHGAEPAPIPASLLDALAAHAPDTAALAAAATA